LAGNALAALVCCALLAVVAAANAATADVTPAVSGYAKDFGMPGTASRAADASCSQVVTAVSLDAASSAPGSSCADFCRCGNVPTSCTACVTPAASGAVSEICVMPAVSGAVGEICVMPAVSGAAICWVRCNTCWDGCSAWSC